MRTKFALLSTNKYFIALLALLGLLMLPFIIANVGAQTPYFMIWVFDKGLDDSQFGYYDGAVTQATTPLYQAADIEGLACLNNIIYASGGRDGKAPSTLNTLVIDTVTNQATLTKIADIHTVDGAAFFEVVSLSASADGTLWGYADTPPLRGLIQIEPTTGVAALIVPFDHKVEGIAWVDNTLWLAGFNHLYRWTPGGNITLAFDVAGVSQIEALEAIEGLLYAGLNDDVRSVIALDPTTGAIVKGMDFLTPDDIEGLTFCSLQPTIPPTPTLIINGTGTSTALRTPTLTVNGTETTTVTSTPTLTVNGTATTTALGTVTPAITPTATRPTLVEPPTGLDPVDEPALRQTSTLYLPLFMQ